MTAWLLIYATTHGHTAKVARRIAGSLGQENGDVDIRDIKEAGEANPADYDAVVAGASLHVGHHQPAMTHWVKRHRVELAARPSAFFSVSLTAADDTEEARVETTKCIDEFVKETGWAPAIVKPIAGGPAVPRI